MFGLRLFVNPIWKSVWNLTFLTEWMHQSNTGSHFNLSDKQQQSRMTDRRPWLRGGERVSASEKKGACLHPPQPAPLVPNCCCDDSARQQLFILNCDASAAMISRRVSHASPQVFPVSGQHPTFSSVMLFEPDKAADFSKETAPPPSLT